MNFIDLVRPGNLYADWPKQFIRIMKLTIIIMTSFLLQVSAITYAQITLSEKNMPFEKVIKNLKVQSGYDFFYNGYDIKHAKPVTLNLKNVPLADALKICFADQDLTYTIEDRTVVIKAKEPTFLERVVATLSNIDIYGFVLDAENRPLPGASVRVKKTGKAVSTDTNGKFFLRGVEEGAVLVISFVGYVPKEVSASANMGTIVLEQSLSKLDEVMIQAYGTTTRRHAVGEISQVNGEDIAQQAVSNPILALAGMVPGMMVTPNSGYSSAPVKIEIRGRKSIDPSLPSDPLYVIDGVPLIIPNVGLPNTGLAYENGSPGVAQSGGFLNGQSIGQSPLFSLNPNDIESITVLKDASATAVYGSRAGNGVILINTKKGKPGQIQINVGLANSIKLTPGHFDALNTSQYLEMRREAFRNAGVKPTITTAPDLVLWDTTRYADWQKILLGSGHSTDATASISGGTDLLTYNLSTSYSSIQDLTPVSNANKNQKATVGLSLRSVLSPKLVLTLQTTYGYTRTNQVLQPDAFLLPPNAPPIFDKDGNLNFAEWNAAGESIRGQFPFGSILSSMLARSYFLNSGLLVSYQLARGLNFKLELGYNNIQYNSYSSVPIAAQNPLDHPLGSTNYGNNGNIGINIGPNINYNTHIGKGILDLLIGATLNNTNSHSLSTIGNGYTSDLLLKSLNGAPNTFNIQDAAQNKYEDVHARVNYTWADKYSIEFSGNRDGSSSFGPGRQFANFGSVGAYWIATEERWLKQILPSWISLIKINCSYGTIGVSGRDYQYLSQWSSSGATANLYPYNGQSTLTTIHAVNQDYHWQTTRTLNTSLGLGLLNDRVSLNVTAYRSRCNDQLSDLVTPWLTGFSSVLGNSKANVQNTGTEINLSTKIIDAKEFSWVLTLNAAKNNNKLLDFPDIESTPYYTQYKIGQSLNNIYLMHYLGIDPQTGTRVVEDHNKDGVITSSTSYNGPPGTGISDAYVIINRIPKIVGGGQTRFTYQNITLSFNFNMKFGNRTISPYTERPGSMRNAPPSIFSNRWQRPGDVSLNPSFAINSYNSDTNFVLSDGAYVDASSLRLQNINIDYLLPGKWCKKLGVKGANLALSMQNIFTLTRYPGMDADILFGTPPQPKIIDFRIGCSF